MKMRQTLEMLSGWLPAVHPGREGVFVLIFSFFFLFTASPSFASGGSLSNPQNRADYVIIGPTSYLPVAEKLAAFRHQENGLTTMVVNIDSVLAQFGGSVSPDTAMKSFIQYAINNWSSPAPQYFVLAGNINTIPSHAEPETLSELGITNTDSVLMIDQWFVQVPGSNGAEKVDACIGRFPAWDSTEFSIMVDKTIAYENETASAWCNRAISLADYREQDGNLFEPDSRIIQAYLDSLWTDTVSVDVRADSPYHLDQSGFLNLWNQGAGVVNYCGHANQTQLSYSKYFTTSSVDSLTNGSRLPVCLLGGCDLLFNTRPPESIPTHLLDRDSGGAVAVVSSSGLMYETETVLFFTSMIQSIIRDPGQPLGKDYEAAMQNDPWGVTQRFTFLGDPALIIKQGVVPTLVTNTNGRPLSFSLEQNYPNPFNPATTIPFEVPPQSGPFGTGSGFVSLKVYDVLGRLVATLVNRNEAAGRYSVQFNGAALASGVYFYRLTAGSCVQTRKMVLVK